MEDDGFGKKFGGPKIAPVFQSVSRLVKHISTRPAATGMTMFCGGVT